jgi:hypothetical protein
MTEAERTLLLTVAWRMMRLSSGEKLNNEQANHLGALVDRVTQEAGIATDRPPTALLDPSSVRTFRIS